MIYHILAAFILLTFFAGPCRADTVVYGWIARNGTIEFTDNKTRVPDAYLDEVQQATISGLHGYARLTVVEPDEE